MTDLLKTVNLLDWHLAHGDALNLLPELPSNSVDSVVTDPPYELGFMGKGWDKSGIAFNVDLWLECLRVLKPGGYLLSFGAPRLYHRMACAVEDAGFEIRDCLGWLYGQGFPKSLNIGDGLGTALKPAWEPIIMARKPLDGTVAENVARYGTGAIRIDDSRIAGEPVPINKLESWSGFGQEKRPDYEQEINEQGRWPANLLHDGSEDVLSVFPETGKSTGGRIGKKASSTVNNVPAGTYHQGDPGYGDSGSAARFFYCAKVSRREREAGCEHLPTAKAGEVTGGRKEGSAGLNSPRAGAGRSSEASHNTHPTVKPIALMRYLVRMVTRPGGLVLDPFAGSGTTGCAAAQEKRFFLGFDLSAEYVAIAKARIAYWAVHDLEFEPAASKNVDERRKPMLELD